MRWVYSTPFIMSKTVFLLATSCAYCMAATISDTTAATKSFLQTHMH